MRNEKSRDRIPYVIGRLKDAIINTEKFIEDMKNKNISIHYFKSKSVHSRLEQELVEVKPENPEYDKIAKNRIMNEEYVIKNMKKEVEFLQKRFEDWKEVK